MLFRSSEPEANNVLIVQNIADTIPAYTPPALSFSANTWKNMVDPSHIEIPFILERGDEFVQKIDFCQ